MSAEVKFTAVTVQKADFIPYMYENFTAFTYNMCIISYIIIFKVCLHLILVMNVLCELEQLLCS